MFSGRNMDEAAFSKSIIELVSDFTWEVDGNWVFINIEWNPGKYRPYTAELIGKTLFDFMEGDSAAALSGQLRSIAAERKKINRFRIVFTTQHSGELALIFSGIPLVDENGSLTGYRGIAYDVNENMSENSYIVALAGNLTETAGINALSEQRFRNMFESAPQGIAIADSNGFIIQVNNAWKKMFGLADTDPANLHMNEFRSASNREHDLKLYRSLMKNRISMYRIERLFTKKNGQTFWCDLTVRLVDDPDSPQPYAIGLYVDITDRKILEEYLRSSEEFVRILLNESPLGIGAVNNGRLVFVNNAFSSMFGFDSPSDMNNLEIKNILTKKSAKELLIQIDDEKPWMKAGSIMELRAVRQNGSRFTVSCKFGLLNIREMQVQIVFTEDITGKKKNERRIKKFREDLEKLVEERTEEIRKLNRQVFRTQEDERQRIARDLHDGVGQTLLAAKLSFSSSIRAKSTAKKELLRHGMELMDMASQELREVYTGLYPSILSELGLGDTISWFIRNYLATAGIRVDYTNRVTENIPEFIAINLYRIIQELFNNIIKHSGADHVEITLMGKPDFIVAVTDNGTGFDVEKTRRSGKGAGLTNIRQRVEYMDGKIYISSIAGNTSVVIIIPGENK